MTEVEGSRKGFPTEEKQVSEEALDFMKSILALQKERIRIDDVLDHRFL